MMRLLTWNRASCRTYNETETLECRIRGGTYGGWSPNRDASGMPGGSMVADEEVKIGFTLTMTTGLQNSLDEGEDE